MSLYDDLDNKSRTSAEKVAAWSSGIKLLQSQLQLKKAAVTQPKRDSGRKAAQLAPVIDLKSKPTKEDEDIYQNITPIVAVTSLVSNVKDYDWDIVGEYDPMWPNDYDKVVKDIRERRDRRREDDREERTEKKRKSRFGDDDDLPIADKREMMLPKHESDEEEEMTKRNAGATIAPPPSLQDSGIPSLDRPGISLGGYGASSVAAKIMAKYGFKEGQGLGKKEQGMSVALQVEKTSKRGGRIIHEKDTPLSLDTLLPPPMSPALAAPDSPLPAGSSPQPATGAKNEPTITEIMKSPSKVVLLRNMVGPGDVDEDLEPEVKDECNTKYGDVIKVIPFEIPGVVPEEAVRIFVEFKRIESAIKAVVDLNGRFFGGRQVRAGFYNVERFAALQLLD